MIACPRVDNPFEFLALDDAAFTGVMEALEAFAAKLTWRELREVHGLDDLVRAVGCEETARHVEALVGSGKEVWDCMDEQTLEFDNKLYGNRVNLLVFAMRRFDLETMSFTKHEDGHSHLCFELLCCREYAAEAARAAELGAPNLGGVGASGGESGDRPAWWRVLRWCCARGESYKKSAGLLIWDLICNATAAYDIEAYRKTCEESYLNPALVDQHAEIFAGAVSRAFERSGAPRAVLGFQEFPARGTPRCLVFEDAFRRAGFTLRRNSGSCVLAYAGFPADAEPDFVADGGDDANGGAFSCRDLMRRRTRNSDGSSKFDKRTTDIFENTTASRTFVNRLGGVLFIIVHVKEPKSVAAVELLAHYLADVRDACRNADDEPFTMLVDTNLPKRPLDDAFIAACAPLNLQISPYVATTSKRRSYLNGQCYDTSKCHVTVTAAKDKFLADENHTLHLLPCHPVLDDANHATTLPTSAWPSDHALVTANFVAPP